MHGLAAIEDYSKVRSVYSSARFLQEAKWRRHCSTRLPCSPSAAHCHSMINWREQETSRQATCACLSHTAHHQIPLFRTCTSAILLEKVRASRFSLSSLSPMHANPARIAYWKRRDGFGWICDWDSSLIFRPPRPVFVTCQLNLTISDEELARGLGKRLECSLLYVTHLAILFCLQVHASCHLFQDVHWQVCRTQPVSLQQLAKLNTQFCSPPQLVNLVRLKNNYKNVYDIVPRDFYLW